MISVSLNRAVRECPDAHGVTKKGKYANKYYKGSHEIARIFNLCFKFSACALNGLDHFTNKESFFLCSDF